MRVKSAHLIAAGMALALVGWLLSGTLDAESEPVTASDLAGSWAELMAVQVRESTAESIERELVVNGKTAPVRAVQIRAETGGRVIEVGAARGADVRQGELLVRLDPRERAALVDEAEATLRRRQIEYEAARKLGEKGYQAETKVAEYKAYFEAAEAMLERAEIEFDHTEIRAPFDGVLDQRPVEVGDFLDVGDAVATVVEQDPFLIRGEVGETEVGQLELGMPGSARLVTGDVVQGRLSYIANQADPGTRTFAVELEVDNPSGRFSAGASAELRIAYERLGAHRVSPALLTLNDAGALGIKAVGADDRVVFHPADIVRSEADAVWLAGLPAELTLITVGQGFVRPGDRVQPMPEIGDDATAAETTS
jgi:multidrug efflux system membrane fusion protein